MGQVVNEYQGERIVGDSLEKWWPLMEKNLQTVPHIWQKWWTLDGLRLAILEGRVQAWGFGPNTTVRVIVMTQILWGPHGPYLLIFMAFGNGLKQALPSIIATLEWFSEANDCVYTEIRGREGWQRLMKKYGYTQDYVVLSRPVNKMGTH